MLLRQLLSFLVLIPSLQHIKWNPSAQALLPPCQLCAELLQTPSCHVPGFGSTAGRAADTLGSIRTKTSQGTPNKFGLKVGNEAHPGRGGWEEKEKGEKTRNVTSNFKGSLKKDLDSFYQANSPHSIEEETIMWIGRKELHTEESVASIYQYLKGELKHYSAEMPNCP